MMTNGDSWRCGGTPLRLPSHGATTMVIGNGDVETKNEKKKKQKKEKGGLLRKCDAKVRRDGK